MKNTSILIPIILIGCLAALGFLFYKALQTVEEDRGRGNNPIVLNEADYADGDTPTDVGATTDYDATNAGNLSTGNDAADVNNANADTGTGTGTGTKNDSSPTDEEARQRQEEEARLTEAAERARQEEANRIKTSGAASTTNSNFETAKEPSGNGRYLVIAGSFRQRAGAQERVNALRKAGFSSTRLEKFNKGTYAVALAGQSNRYSDAERMAGKIVAAGFEAKVMRRR